jgi:hypothetical protein
MAKYIVTVVVTTQNPVTKKALKEYIEGMEWADSNRVHPPMRYPEKIRVRSVDED